MCGIAGVLTQCPDVARRAVQAMNAAQVHRGPDDEGLVTLSCPAGALVLGHRRLSILDTSAAGHQPMNCPTSGDWIVFNGEIYNFLTLKRELEGAGHQFRSRCDTEVLLHAYARWGTDCFERLEGMFAVALFDARRRRLVLARDPLGMKPLYYASDREAFVFASEVRTVRASELVNDEIDQRALAGLLAFGAVQSPLTMYRHVRMLDAGTWAVLQLDKGRNEGLPLEARRYWTFPTLMRQAPPPEELKAAIRQRLRHAVESHLVSDVPVGVFLSGGLDSSAIAALSAHFRGADVDTFTVALGQDRGLDENPVAERTARHIGVRHRCVELSDAEAQHQYSDWLQCLDQPGVDGLNTYIVAGAARLHGIVVALSGVGGDELFAGYSTFREVPRQRLLALAAQWIHPRIRGRIAQVLCSRMKRPQRNKAIDMATSRPTLSSMLLHRRRLLSNSDMQLLGFDASDLELDEHFMPHESTVDSLYADDPVASLSVLESRHYMGNTLLRDSDVFGMAHGMEIRLPLLDQKLANYVLSVPGAARLSPQGYSKPLLADAISSDVPQELIRSRKRGFALPHARWMAGPLRDRFESLLEEAGQSGLVEPAAARALWRDFLADTGGPTWSRPWLLGVLGQWLVNQRDAKSHSVAAARAA